MWTTKRKRIITAILRAQTAQVWGGNLRWKRMAVNTPLVRNRLREESRGWEGSLGETRCLLFGVDRAAATRSNFEHQQW